MRAFAELPLHVGFRAGVFLSRRYGHVSFGDASVLMDQTKSGRDRRMPLIPAPSCRYYVRGLIVGRLRARTITSCCEEGMAGTRRR